VAAEAATELQALPVAWTSFHHDQVAARHIRHLSGPGPMTIHVIASSFQVELDVLGRERRARAE
jgi:hypothetical protein